MKLSSAMQLTAAGWFLLAGAGLGLLYDLLGGLRDRMHLPAWAADGLFCLFALSALYVGGMLAQEGQFRLYMLLFSGLGGAVWGTMISPVSRGLWRALWGKTARRLQKLAAPLRAGWAWSTKETKKLFSNLRKWFTILKGRIRAHRAQYKSKKRG